jgi:hypothetical protein
VDLSLSEEDDIEALAAKIGELHAEFVRLREEMVQAGNTVGSGVPDPAKFVPIGECERTVSEAQ